MPTHYWPALYHIGYELTHTLQTSNTDNFVVCKLSPHGKIAEPQKFNIFVIMVISLRAVSKLEQAQ